MQQAAIARLVHQILPMAAALSVACAYAGTPAIDNRLFSLDLPAGWTINAAAENVSSMPEGSLQAMHITPGPYMASQNITADGPDRIVGMKHVGHHVGISWMAILPPLEKARLANFQKVAQGFLTLPLDSVPHSRVTNWLAWPAPQASLARTASG
jgi:hypothetical protein